MDMLQHKGSRMDSLFQTGYPHPINLFVTLILALLPILSPFSGDRRPWLNVGISIGLALVYLVIWSRVRVFDPVRSPRFYRNYLILQSVMVSLIYLFGGDLTRFLFVVVVMQAVYITPVRRWLPSLGTLAVLWLTLYLAIYPGDPGANMVSTIGMYLCYLVFAALVTFTVVQQERQNRVAQKLLDDVDARYHALRAADLTLADRTEMEERERLAKTICATLLSRLGALLTRLDQFKAGAPPLDRQHARSLRLEAKEVLTAVRSAVRTLRPGEQGELDDQDENPFATPASRNEVPPKWTDPVRVYHFWNLGVVVITLGVMIASSLVGGTARWLPLLLAGLGLIAAYGATAIAPQPWNRTLFLVVQAGLVVTLVRLSREPLMNHLFLIISAQMVFLAPPLRRWLVAAVLFPTLFSGAAMFLTDQFAHRHGLLITLTAAYFVTNFFGAVMAYMTLRQLEARERAVLYTQQLVEVNRQLEIRLHGMRQMAIARERVRMAREIHDGLGHLLTIVIVDLQIVEQLADEDPVAAITHIRSAYSVVKTAMATSRDMVNTLDTFDRPLPNALRDLVKAWQSSNRAKVTLRLTGHFKALSTAARITLYRAVQESLTNIQKHARAEQVTISLVQLVDRVTLIVTNDDLGGASPLETGHGGFGLLGLVERAEALQGECIAGPLNPSGYRVRLILPLGV